MQKQTVVTDEGLKRLENELAELKAKRTEVAEKLKVARGFGDLSENSEYDEAKNEQAIIEGRIVELEARLKNVKVLDESQLSNDRVNIGATVEVKCGKVKTVFKIVSTSESNPAEGLISDESPVGRALLDHEVGDKVEVEIPNGVVTYTIQKISR